MFVFNKNMRVGSINYTQLNIKNNLANTNKKTNFLNPLINIPSFKRGKSIISTVNEEENLPADYESRIAFLKENNIDEFYAQSIAGLPAIQYKRALDLIEQNVFEQSIAHVAQLNDEKYSQAQSLIEMGIIDQNLTGLANNNKRIFERIKDLRQKGLHIDYLMLYCKLTKKQYEDAIKLIEEGYQQNIAAYLVQLTQEQKEIFVSLINNNIYAPLAFEVAKQKQEVRDRTLNFIRSGIYVYDAIEISKLSKRDRKKAEKLLKTNIGDSNIANLSKLKGKDRKRAKELFNAGVFPEYICDLISIENGLTENEDYKRYLEKGYSRTMSYSLSLLSEEELELLLSLLKKFPEIEELFKDNYDINIIENQLTETDSAEAILSKEMRTQNGTLITIVKTFSEDGIKTESRIEEYKDHSTSSYVRKGNRLVRINYNKFGQIDEILQIIEDEKTHSVEGAVYSKASKILPGAYDSVYYDISEFRQDNSSDEKAMDFDISNIVTGDGTQLSKAIKNPDGSITYTEKYNVNDCISERRYEEKKNINGNIINSNYSYKISLSDGTVLMDINRSRHLIDKNKVSETINGIKYIITFDDKNKTISISDGKKNKTINFSEILPYYSNEIIWKTIKSQPIDTLLTIAKKVDKWSYCNDQDSQIYSHTDEICTGEDLSVIAHETGHVEQKIKSDTIYNDDFLEVYDQEMTNFLINFSFNEQEFIQYLSPRADLSGSIGYEEFISEVNLLLTTYGSPVPSLTTRSQIISRYFPKSIAKVAEILGKTSKKSILEELV